MKNKEQIFERIKDGHNIFIHTAACNPTFLVEQACDYIQQKNLKGIHFYHLHIEGEAVHLREKYKNHVQTNCFFVGKNARMAMKEGRVSYIPVFLSEIGELFRNRQIDLDLSLIQVSPFDKRGLCTLGPSVDVTIDAIDQSKQVIAMVNQKMPRVHGTGVLRKEEIDHFIEHDIELPQSFCHDLSDQAKQIGKLISELIEDGSTLQMGIGEIPNAVLANLHHHRDLGIHSEMFSDGLIPLIENGAISNRHKKVHPHKIVSSFAVGTQKLYDYLDDNPLMLFMSASFINDPRVIMKNPKVCAINSAIEVDLTGQVCADSIGHQIYSGVGGQVDFIRGASLSPGGKAIIALQSQTKKGQSKIVSELKQGAGVVTTRAHVDYVITEFGVASLKGKNLHQRARELIQVAHPDHREQLEKDSYYLDR